MVLNKGKLLSCDTEGVIYLVTCKKCGLQYVGQTKNQLNKRWHTYFSDAKAFFRRSKLQSLLSVIYCPFLGKRFDEVLHRR